MSRRAFFERQKPYRCPDCRRKGISPNTYACRYCGWESPQPTMHSFKNACEEIRGLSIGDRQILSGGNHE